MPAIRIALIPSTWEPGTVDICAVDEAGVPLPRGYLVAAEANGRFRRHGGIDDTLGLPLDEAGRLILEN